MSALDKTKQEMGRVTHRLSTQNIATLEHLKEAYHLSWDRMFSLLLKHGSENIRTALMEELKGK